MDPESWYKLSTVQQLGNIGAEIGRTITWKKNPAFGNYQDSFYRGLEYIDLSISDSKNAGHRRREICRVREALVDWYFGSKLYQSTDDDWDRYFNSFAILANRK